MIAEIRCTRCHNVDPERFHRIYVEASRERLVDGDWTVVSAWEFDDGAQTHTVCERCGSSAVEEAHASSPGPGAFRATHTPTATPEV